MLSKKKLKTAIACTLALALSIPAINYSLHDSYQAAPTEIA